jgi:hypothetical protein
MERWLKILLGTVFSSIAAIVFFFIYDQLLIYYRKKRHVKEDKPVMHMQHVFRNGEQVVASRVNSLLPSLHIYCEVSNYSAGSWMLASRETI